MTDLPQPSSPPPDGFGASDRDERRPWSRSAIVGTVLLFGVMVAAGIFAAITVTPTEDEFELSRPPGADLVISSGTPVSWDTAVISDSVSAQLLSQIYEGLTVLDADSQVRPALAETWQVEDDGHRIVFKLRDGIAFSDGTPITADDVRRSWLRVIDPDSSSPLASLLDDVAGAAAYQRGEGSAAGVGLTADGQDLIVDFERPASYFPAVAATPSLAVVPPDIDALTRGPREGTELRASGPYVPVDRVAGEIRLEANPRYWAGPPSIDRVSVITDDGGRSRVDVFEDDAVDWTRISDFDAAWIRYDRQLGPQLRYTPELSVDFLGFDSSEPPFDDPAVRRAVAQAVDWRRLAALDDADAVAPRSIVPPGITDAGDGDYLLAFDPDAARATLASAGYPDGLGFPTVELATYGVGPADAISQDLARELGIEVLVERRPFGELGAILEADAPAMWTMAWSADYPHAHDFLGLLLRSGSSANEGGWADAEYDALIDAAAATADTDEQARLYAMAQEILREQVPIIPLGYGGTWALSRDGLHGAEVSAVGQLRLADLEWAS